MSKMVPKCIDNRRFGPVQYPTNSLDDLLLIFTDTEDQQPILWIIIPVFERKTVHNASSENWQISLCVSDFSHRRKCSPSNESVTSLLSRHSSWHVNDIRPEIRGRFRHRLCQIQ